jgi:hypothetical protein
MAPLDWANFPKMNKVGTEDPMSLRSTTSVAAFLSAFWLVPDVAAFPAYAPATSRLRPVELRDLIYGLMPADGRQLGDGVADRLPLLTTFDTPGYRMALARVTVDGVRSVRRRPREEMAWTLTFKRKGASGPTTVTIEPGVHDDACFGRNFSGCNFTERQMLPKGVRWRPVCRQREFADVAQTYLVTATTGGAMLVTYRSSEGSGGASQVVELNEPSEQKVVCAGF